jgi:zinc-dependent metalloproteinase lipoprotein
MKRSWVYLLLIAIAFTACKTEDEIIPLVETSAYNVEYNAENLVIPITSTIEWSVTSDASWCTPYFSSGTASKSLVLSLTGNITTSARTANLTFTNAEQTQAITVTQAAGTGSEYHYKLPVVFHVLYQSTYDSLQYVKRGWLNTIIAGVNKLYSANNINMEFELATYDPNGNTLDEAGVDRQQITQSSLDFEKFMEGKLFINSKLVSMLWDLDKYVNIFLYKFKSDDPDYVTMGITDLPYTSSSHTLSGLQTGEYYLTHSWDYPQCSSINSDYIYHYDANSNYYDVFDVAVTIAHELGHYIGLDHVFTEIGESDCSGDDYCDDTPNYNREEYEKWVSNYLDKYYDANKTTLADVAIRTCCEDNSTFTARNIMDYEYCYSDKFTTNQNERMRYIMKYGLFIPGPKYDTTSASSRSINDAAKPVIHCEAKTIKKTLAEKMQSAKIRIR